MNALHFLSKNFALIAGKKGRLFRKGWRDNENKKSEKLFRFHYEHSTPILSNCLYMFCRIMQPCCNMFLVLLFEMGLVSVHTVGGGGLREQDVVQNRRSCIHREIKVKRTGRAQRKCESQVKGRRPCPCIKEPFRPRSIVSIFKVPWCLGRDESRAFWEAPAMTMPTLKSFLFSFLCLTLVLKPSMHEAYWSLAVPLVVVHRQKSFILRLCPVLDTLDLLCLFSDGHLWFLWYCWTDYKGRLWANCTCCCFTAVLVMN